MTSALAFDVYGTLVDPIAISTEFARHLPGDAAPGLARLRADGSDLADRLPH